MNSSQLEYPKVSIIILNWNKLYYLKQCIDNVIKNTFYPNYEIIIFDNASTEDSSDEYFLSLPYIIKRSPVNIGFAKGNNEASKYATGEYLLFLNNDTIPKYDWLRPMVDLMLNKEKCGIVGSRLLYPDETIQHIGIYFDYKRKIKHYFRNYPNNIPEALSVRECEAVTGACMLIKKSLFEEVGGFDERYVHGVEDIDLCLKVREKGYHIVYCPHSTLIHFEGISLNNSEVKNLKRFRKRLARRNEKIFCKKWGEKIDSMRLEPYHSKFKPYNYYCEDSSSIIKLIPLKAKSILDIGCGEGFLAREIRKAFSNKKIVGVDIDSISAKKSEVYMDNVIEGDIETITIPEYYLPFDCIILTGILEHIKDPWLLLKRLSTYLSGEGVIIASFQNMRHYNVIKDIIRGRWFYREHGLMDGNHLRFFDLSSIKQLFFTSGFEIIKIDRIEDSKGLFCYLKKISPDMLREFLTLKYIIAAGQRKNNQ